MGFVESLGASIGAYLRPAILAEVKAAGELVRSEIAKLAPLLEAKIESEIGVIAPQLIPIIEKEALAVGKDVENRLPELANGVARSVVDEVMKPLNAILGPLQNLTNNFPHF